MTTYGYIKTRMPGETYECVGSPTKYMAVVRRVTAREDRTVARFYGRTMADVYTVATRYCEREFGGVGEDPLG